MSWFPPAGHSVQYRSRHANNLPESKDKQEMPEESVLASMSIDNVKVEKLVRQFLEAQSLKILPQAPFGDAVSQFVDKDDKHAMEMFVNESLAGQVKQMLDLDDPEEDLDGAMERYRKKLEEMFASGTLKRSKRKAKYKPRPDNWDSDLDGEWEEQPGALIVEEADEDEDSTPAPRRRNVAHTGNDDDEVPTTTSTGRASAKSATAKKVAPAARAATRAAPKRAPARAAAASKAPAKGRKKASLFISDEDDDEDVQMLDSPPPPSKPAPARTTRAAPRQTQTRLNFSQPAASQRGTRREPSPDEISDDDDDAFEPMAAPSRRR